MALDAGALLSFLKLDTTGFSSGLTSAVGKSQQFNKSMGATDAQVKAMSSSMAGLGKLMLTGLGFFAAFKAVTAFTGAVGDSIDMAANLEKSMANVSTLVDTATVDMDDLTESVLDMTSEVLKSAESLSEGLYQVFSAGITDSAEAMEVLRVSAIAATAGLSTTLTSVDAITTILNAYGLESEKATDISDLMFQTVKLGKTTFDQLAQSIGTVISPAASVGIELDELFASLATLTKGGINTMRATTALRATLLAVIKPSDSAMEAAKRLKIEWSASALKAKGLVRFLTEIRDATGGSSEAMAELFPNVRALNGIMALTGEQFEELIRIQGEFKNRIGSTNEAFGKQADTFSAKTIKMSLAVDRLKTAFGKLTIPALSSTVEFLADAFEDLLNVEKKLDLQRVTNQLTNLGEEIKFLEGLKVKDFGLSPSEIEKVDQKLSRLRQEYSALIERVILLANVLDGSKKSQDAVNESMEKSNHEIRNIILSAETLNDEVKEFALSAKVIGEEFPSVFSEEKLKTALTLSEKQLELMNELIEKANILGKTEKERFELSVKDLIASLREKEENLIEFSQREKDALRAVFVLRKDFSDKEKLEAFQRQNEQIAIFESNEERKARKAEQTKQRRIKAEADFLKQFENAGKTQLQILDRDQARTLEKARQLGQETTQIKKFFAEKRTSIEKNNLEKEFMARKELASNTASFANDLNDALSASGKKRSKELFELAKAANIAQALMNTYQSATKAYAQGGIYGAAFAAVAVAAGLANVAKISAQHLAEGGLTTGPTMALIGDNPSGQEAVLPVESGVIPIIMDTMRDVLNESRGGVAETSQNFTIINVTDARDLEAVAQRAVAESGGQVAINMISRNVTRSAFPRTNI